MDVGGLLTFSSFGLGDLGLPISLLDIVPHVREEVRGDGLCHNEP